MVRLKEAGKYGKIYDRMEFQFHMVRLKATANSVKCRLLSFQFHMVRLKELFWIYSACFLCGFQFHMVRLKGRLTPCLVKELMPFQFHMVRLKVLLLRVSLPIQEYFNSIWYD